jgi:hypothetical protein
MARTGHTTTKQLEGYLHAAGRGLTPSRLPELPPGQMPEPRIVVQAIQDPRETALAVTVEKVRTRADEAADRFKSHRRTRDEASNRRRSEKHRGHGITPLADLAREAVASGDDSPLPLVRIYDEAYSRAYQRHLRAAPADLDGARLAGRRARNAKKGAWRRTLNIAKSQPPKALPPCEPSTL